MEHKADFATATEALMHDHRAIEKVLGAVERLTKASGQLPLETWRKAVDFIRNFADRCHHLKEEGILFPAMEERGIPREGGPIGVMLIEHEEGRAYVRAMAEALSQGEKDPESAQRVLNENARAYLRLLREHIQKEDQILFVMANDAMSPEEQKQLLRAFEEHEAKEIGVGVHEKYLKIAEELGRYGL